MAQVLVLGAPDEGCAGKHGRSIPLTENKAKWLACFGEEFPISVLQNGDRASCSFGTTKANNAGFWKYNSEVAIIITYDGWFGRTYHEQQTIKIVDSDSFTGFHWSSEATPLPA